MIIGEPQFRPDAIRELMEREGLDVPGFARRCGMARTLIGAWLSGFVTPQVGTLTRLCRVFGVSIDYFFTSEVDDEPAGKAAKSA